MPSLPTFSAIRSLRKARNAASLLRVHGEAGSHGMATAIDQQARLARRDDGDAEIDAAHGTARPFADTVLVRDDASGPVESVLEAARDDADDAGVPTVRRHIDQPIVELSAAGHRFDPLDRGLEARGLDSASFLIVVVEPFRDRLRLADVLRGKQRRAQSRLADPTARIDPRPENEAGVIGLERFVDAGDVGKRR